MYGLTQTSAPAEEPVSLLDAKAWCRISTDDDNATVEDLIIDAREYVERVSGRQLVTASYLLTLLGFPGGFGGSAFPLFWLRSGTFGVPVWSIRLPKAPLVSVASVAYYDLANASQALPTTVYDVDAGQDPGTLSLSQYQIWPVTRARPDAVRVAFTAGYGTALDVPRVYTRAIKMLVLYWYENRGEAGGDAPEAVDRLLAAGWNGELEYGS